MHCRCFRSTVIPRLGGALAAGPVAGRIAGFAPGFRRPAQPPSGTACGHCAPGIRPRSRAHTRVSGKTAKTRARSACCPRRASAALPALPPHHRRHEAALPHRLQPSAPGLRQRRLHQPRAHPLAFQRRRHLGVRKQHPAPIDPVIGKGHMPVDGHFKAPARHIVGQFAVHDAPIATKATRSTCQMSCMGCREPGSLGGLPGSCSSAGGERGYLRRISEKRPGDGGTEAPPPGGFAGGERGYPQQNQSDHWAAASCVRLAIAAICVRASRTALATHSL